MWTCVTLVYLVPAAVIAVTLLAPDSMQEPASAPSKLEMACDGD
jgi:hypothetical protein